MALDMQNDFAAPGGMFDSAGIDISLIRRALAPTQNVLAAARKVPMPITSIKMEFQPDLSDFGAKVYETIVNLGDDDRGISYPTAWLILDAKKIS
jgi:nicotinamidase-related amidase